MEKHTPDTVNILKTELQWDEVATNIIKLIPSMIWLIKEYVIPRLKSRRLADLHGKVTNELPDAPVEGILVTCKGAKGLYTAITSDDGSYQLKGLPPGNYTVMFTDPQGRYGPRVV